MQRRIPLIYLSIWFASLTILFTIMVIKNRLTVIDRFFYDLYTLGTNPFLEKIIKGITSIADTKTLSFISLLAFVWLLIRKSPLSQVLLFLVVMGGGIVITFIMKLTIERERPGEVVFVDFWGLGNHLVSYSFPSGHAIKALLFFGCVYYFVRKEIKNLKLKQSVGVLFMLVVIFIGIGQVILNKHYASDVIGGYFVGTTWFLFCIAIYHSSFLYKTDANEIKNIKL
ncbi:phosphatase PAP2 family protein [Fredinandcohnia humi]